MREDSVEILQRQLKNGLTGHSEFMYFDKPYSPNKCGGCKEVKEIMSHISVEVPLGTIIVDSTIFIIYLCEDCFDTVTAAMSTDQLKQLILSIDWSKNLSAFHVESTKRAINRVAFRFKESK